MGVFKPTIFFVLGGIKMNNILKEKGLLPTPETIHHNYSILLNEIGKCIFQDMDRIKNRSLETYESFYKSHYEKILHTRFELEKQIKETDPIRPFECICMMYNIISDDMVEYIIDKFPEGLSNEDFYRILNNRQQAYQYFIDSIKSMWEIKIRGRR